MNASAPYILMLEDDSDDRELTAHFFATQHTNVRLQFVTEKEEVLQHLQHCMNIGAPLPSLILIDKYIQVNSGIDVLKAVKAHPVLKLIPAVMISGSSHPEDIAACYSLGANSYIVKPAYAEATAQKIAAFVAYWFGVAELPTVQVSSAASM